MITKIFAITIAVSLLSCQQSQEHKAATFNQKDTQKATAGNKEKERLAERKQIEEDEKSDSINLDRILSDAIKIANQIKTNGKLKKEYVAMMADSSYQVTVAISSDFYFTKQYQHLVVRRNTSSIIYIDIFSRIGRQYKKVVAHEQPTLDYRSDTILDINGDGLNDFVVNWYGNTGCCLKAFSDVYLLRHDKGEFSNSFEFINPTFSAKEKVIRGVCYGQPGGTEMYKYRWNGESIDTIEYIYYEENEKGEKTGKVIISNNRPYENNHKVLKRLNAVPSEYTNIKGYDWFTGEGY